MGQGGGGTRVLPLQNAGGQTKVVSMLNGGGDTESVVVVLTLGTLALV